MFPTNHARQYRLRLSAYAVHYRDANCNGYLLSAIISSPSREIGSRIYLIVKLPISISIAHGFGRHNIFSCEITYMTVDRNGFQLQLFVGGQGLQSLPQPLARSWKAICISQC